MADQNTDHSSKEPGAGAPGAKETKDSTATTDSEYQKVEHGEATEPTEFDYTAIHTEVLRRMQALGYKTSSNYVRKGITVTAMINTPPGPPKTDKWADAIMALFNEAIKRHKCSFASNGVWRVSFSSMYYRNYSYMTVEFQQAYIDNPKKQDHKENDDKKKIHIIAPPVQSHNQCRTKHSFETRDNGDVVCSDCGIWATEYLSTLDREKFE